jgi:hypothetical protein
LFKILKNQIKYSTDNPLKALNDVFKTISSEYENRVKEFLNYQKDFRVKMLNYQSYYKNFASNIGRLSHSIRIQEIKITVLNMINSFSLNLTIKRVKSASGSIFQFEFEQDLSTRVKGFD